MGATPSDPMRCILTAGCLLAALVTALAGCSSAPRDRGLEQVIAARGLEPEAVVIPYRLTPEMRSWLRERFPPRPGARVDLPRLLRLLEAPTGLDLEYETGYTGTAAEVFASRKFNCLSFSHLFVGLARELGSDPSYHVVGRVRRFRREGDVVLVSGHVTVGYGVGSGRRLIQFNVGPDVNYRIAERISDLTAVALHYANRGAEMIQAGAPERALGLLETATRLDPHLAAAWVNLGVARRRVGQLDDAERCYLRAVEIDRDFFPAYRNLAALQQVRGRTDVAADLLAMLDRRGNRNPWAFLALGDHSLDNGRLEEAESFYRRALRLAVDKAEPAAALGLLAAESGALAEARQWLDRARLEDPHSERAAELAVRLGLEEPARPHSEDFVIRRPGNEPGGAR